MSAYARRPFLLDILEDKVSFQPARYMAMKCAARLQMKGMIPAIETLLNNERPGRTMMQAAAWSLYVLTGKTPAVPEPRVIQSLWMVKNL